MDISSSQRGMYTTACEKSKYRQDIDRWMNEGKSNAWIATQLKSLGDPISAVSVGKYRSYRDEYIQKQLMEEPIYQAKIQKANEVLIEEAGKFKEINVINHLGSIVEHCAELIGSSKLEDIRIKNIQDLRFVQMSMLDALKLYGDTIMKAQQFAKIEDDPSLIKPTVNVNVKGVLADLMSSMTEEQKFALIDKIRDATGGDTDG